MRLPLNIQLVLFFAFTSVLLTGQNLERVEIQMEDGSVKKGLLDFKSELKALPELKYYKNRDADMIKILAADVKSFSVGGFNFFKANVEVESSSERKKELSNKKDPIMRMDAAFLLPIVEGPKSLYYYQDAKGKEHLLIQKEGKYEALIYKKYADYFGSVIRMRQYRKYVGQLSQYLATDDWRVDFTSYQYELDKIKELFLFYYRVNGLEPSYVYGDKPDRKKRKKKR